MFTLETEKSMRVEPAGAARIACHSGIAWVTCEGDPRDHILTPGQRVEVGSGTTMVTAFEPTVVSVTRLGEQFWRLKLWRALQGLFQERSVQTDHTHAKRSPERISPLPYY